MNSSEHTVAISAEKICKRFGQVTALDDVSFEVRKGDLFFLLGPSGCGKTTMLRILAGLETPDSGTVRFNGRDIAGLPPHERNAPMVFQNYALWPHLSVADNIGFGLVERKVGKAEIRDRVAATLQRVGLADMGKRMPGQLSGGQQQRVVLARALVLNPDILLLDEPLSNLDARLRVEMRGEIEKLHAETDITFVYVTHDQVEALSLADRMAVMDRGRINAIGAPADLYHRPPNAFCADFLGEANLVPGRIAGKDGSLLVIETPFGRWHGVPPGDSGQAPATGTEVKCLVRPEHLRADGDTRDNQVDAEIESVRLAGSTTAVALKTAHMNLKAVLLSGYRLQTGAGKTAKWYVSSENTVVLSR